MSDPVSRAAGGDDRGKATPPAVAPAHSGSVRRRRSRRSLWLLAVASALWLLGRGLGLFGGGPLPEHGQMGAVASGPDQAAAAVRPTAAEQHAASAARAAGSSDSEPLAAPTGETAGAEAPGVEPPTTTPELQASAADGMPADRFASLLSLIELRLADGELGSATASLQRLRAQQLDARQRLQLAELATRLTIASNERGAELLTLLRRGEVLAALEQCRRLVAEDRLQFGAEVAAALPRLAPEGDWLRAVQHDDRPVPLPAALVRNRRVRLEWRGELQVGVVVSSRSDQVTVRVKTNAAQSYPTVLTVACEPIEADAAEAVDMGLVAVAAGQPLLARLWLARALLVAPDSLDERGERLLELLR